MWEARHADAPSSNRGCNVNRDEPTLREQVCNAVLMKGACVRRCIVEEQSAKKMCGRRRRRPLDEFFRLFTPPVRAHAAMDSS
jgi:hypothetical protein